MEDSETEGTETEPLVTKKTSDEKGLVPEAPKRSSLHPKPPLKPYKEHVKKGSISSPHSWAPPPPHDNSPLQPLQEFNEEPTLEEVHLPQRKIQVADSEHGEHSYMLCPFFGVKNYLHYFYEKPDLSPGINEAREEVLMVNRGEGLCSASVFRLSLLLGGIILLMGVTAFIVAACASRKTTLIGKLGGVPVEDRVAAVHNAEVDTLLLVGLIAVTLGASVITSALISKTFCSRRDYEDSFRDGIPIGYASVYDHPQFIPSMQRKVPATEELTQVQPWKGHTKGPISIKPCFHHAH